MLTEKKTGVLASRVTVLAVKRWEIANTRNARFVDDMKVIHVAQESDVYM